MTRSSSHSISRRQLLSGAGGLAVAVVAPHASHAFSRPFVTSESGRLRTVLVNPAAAADFADCGAMSGASSFWQESVDDIVAQNSDLALQLESAGVRVIHLESELDSAIDVARRQGVLAGWLSRVFPEFSDSENVRAAMLLARNPTVGAVPGAGVQQAMHGLCYLRDFAVMLPRGLVLGNVADARRSRQQALFRFMVTHAPAFRDIPVLFDARAAGFTAEGGDIQVLDERTLLLGVGNHTDSRVAAALARSTGMEVVAVNLCNADPGRWQLGHDPLRDFYLHLNTSVAQLAPAQMLALPWLFEAEHTGHAALRRPDPLLGEFGIVAKYRAWTGEEISTANGLKLVDCLRASGTRFSFIGDTGRNELERMLTDVAQHRVIFPRRERQAANVLATAPRTLVAFGGAEQTHRVLRGAGAQICIVAGSEQGRGYAGPHCLTLPLLRA